MFKEIILASGMVSPSDELSIELLNSGGRQNDLAVGLEGYARTTSGVGKCCGQHNESAGEMLAPSLPGAEPDQAFDAVEEELAWLADEDGSAGRRITPVLVVAILAAFLILPAFALLYTLDQKGLPPEEGPEERDRPAFMA